MQRRGRSGPLRHHPVPARGATWGGGGTSAEAAARAGSPITSTACSPSSPHPLALKLSSSVMPSPRAAKARAVSVESGPGCTSAASAPLQRRAGRHGHRAPRRAGRRSAGSPEIGYADWATTGERVPRRDDEDQLTVAEVSRADAGIGNGGEGEGGISLPQQEVIGRAVAGGLVAYHAQVRDSAQESPPGRAAPDRGSRWGRHRSAKSRFVPRR